MGCRRSARSSAGLTWEGVPRADSLRRVAKVDRDRDRDPPNRTLGVQTRPGRVPGPLRGKAPRWTERVPQGLSEPRLPPFDDKGTVELLFAEGFVQKTRENEQKITQYLFSFV